MQFVCMGQPRAPQFKGQGPNLPHWSQHTPHGMTEHSSLLIAACDVTAVGPIRRGLMNMEAFEASLQ